MYITVVGGGNSTPIFATQCKLANPNHKVAILTRKPDQWSKTVSFVNEDPTYLDGKELLEATVDLITSDPAQCIPQSDLIFIAGIPIHFNGEILEQLKPHLNQGRSDRTRPVFIGTICAYGGFNWLAASVLGEGSYFLFGTQQIPWTCGTKEYGKQGVVFGQKANLRICTEVTEKSSDADKGHETFLLDNLKEILVMKNVFKTSFLVGTLWPNNPSVHPPILYGLFKDWDPELMSHKVFLLGSKEAPIYIYKDITPKSAEFVEQLNKEVLAIVQKLPAEILTEDISGCDYMNSLLFAYSAAGVEDTSSIYNAIRTTKAYLKHKNPYKIDREDPDGGQFGIPDVSHKFFTTDLSHGLCTYKDIALMKGVEVSTPLLDAIIYWNQKLIKKEYLVDGELKGKDIAECILPSKFGLQRETLGQGLRN